MNLIEQISKLIEGFKSTTKEKSIKSWYPFGVGRTAQCGPFITNPFTNPFTNPVLLRVNFIYLPRPGFMGTAPHKSSAKIAE